MKNLLFPHAFQLVGWVMFVPSLLMGALVYFGVLSFAGSLETVVNDSVIIGIALGALFVVCSKERVEDEMTRSIRLASLLNSIYVYVTLLIGCTILLNSVDFLAFAVFNMVLLPIIFVCNFRSEMHRYNKMCEDEK
ncbi:hypothetical protein [Lepagella muris]|jgi:hypothetical protein|uniref:Uncharacterized protein n=1 Tax=Lepagella muris TaxID=3032870 RepID=A0AC61RJX9_9BACT|nr:hypothetical protein [Lepagella muris]TGY80260.1 hypothetical protein E5331_03210 [Lepagella muris]THG52799.1 hypothetical protein E5984_05690 [Bacteroidales bacterium]TKC58751.1 hypothetical protein E5359_010340 [Bacteroidales bacterium]